jgi:hypothetical protein
MDVARNAPANETSKTRITKSLSPLLLLPLLNISFRRCHNGIPATNNKKNIHDDIVENFTENFSPTIRLIVDKTLKEIK